MAGLRMLNAFLMSILVTTGLFSFMRAVTDFDGETDATTPAVKLELAKLRPPTEIEPKLREKPKIKKPDPQPVVPTFDRVDEDDARPAFDLTNIARDLGTIHADSRGDGRTGIRGVVFRSGLADRDPLPLVRVDPQYPPQAQQKRLEGWVHVHFTVSSAGSVEDAGVVESSDRVFEQSALQAVAKWKYQPSLRAGKPVAAPDQRVVLRFQQPEG